MICMRVSKEIDIKISNFGIDGAEERISDLKDKSRAGAAAH